MKEFVYGTDAQYTQLKNALHDGQCHVFPNCAYPPCCSRAWGRLGFQMEGETYALFIDRGLTCSLRGASFLFRQWLETGTLRFLDYNDLKTFLRSLRCLY